MKKLFYIGRRDNPQFKKPYFIIYGLLSKTSAKKFEKTIYGQMTLIGYETEEEYNTEIKNLTNKGFRVTT